MVLINFNIRGGRELQPFLEGLSPSQFFAEGHPDNQAATLVLIIGSLYSYNWIQQKIINAIKNRYTLIKQSLFSKSSSKAVTIQQSN